MTYSKDKSTLKHFLEMKNKQVTQVIHQSTFNKMMDNTNASNDAIVIFKFLIASREIADLNKKIKKSLDSTENLKNTIQRCEELKEELKEELEGLEELKEELEELEEELEELEELKEELEELKAELKDVSIRKIEICLDYNNNISIKDYIFPKKLVSRIGFQY